MFNPLKKTENDMAIQFKNIERGNPVWILDKSELGVKQGKVTENQPHIDNTFTMTGTSQMMRDVTGRRKGRRPHTPYQRPCA